MITIFPEYSYMDEISDEIAWLDEDIIDTEERIEDLVKEMALIGLEDCDELEELRYTLYVLRDKREDLEYEMDAIHNGWNS